MQNMKRIIIDAENQYLTSAGIKLAIDITDIRKNLFDNVGTALR
jgi:hypothetical protein